jgi:hypothetical protein
MDGINLLHEARAAGLEVRADGDRLVVRGPRSAEAMALQLLAHKREVLQALSLPPPQREGDEPIVAVKVWSDVLEAALWVIADDLPKEEWPTDAAVYVHQEIKKLLRVGPQTLAWVHVTKMMFGARVIDGRHRHQWCAPDVDVE